VPKELVTLDGDVCAILIIEAQLICQAAENGHADGLRERRDRLLGRLGVRQIEQLLQIVSSLDRLVAPVMAPREVESTPAPIEAAAASVASKPASTALDDAPPVLVGCLNPRDRLGQAEAREMERWHAALKDAWPTVSCRHEREHGAIA
jgi:hypothetical protein